MDFQPDRLSGMAVSRFHLPGAYRVPGAYHLSGLLLAVSILFSGYHVTAGVDYCWEDFNATCADDEVVLMTSALYGRMKIGRCLTRDYYVGCRSDVIRFMDKKCSGRHSCTLVIPDTELQAGVACPKDLVAYLNATFSCVKVAYPTTTHGVGAARTTDCSRSTENTHITTSQLGYISSLVSAESGTGIAPCPWLIKVPKGQKINVTLLDFSVNKPTTSADDMCTMYATLREVGVPSTSDITVCGGDAREKVLYLSDSNRVAIEINAALANNKANMPYFLLRYEPVGCPDMEAPSGGWVQRHEYKMTMGCNNTQEVRHLVCSGNTWVGEPSNCTGGHVISSQDAHGFIRKEVPFGLVLAIVIGVILGIVIGSLLLGVVLYTQNKLKHRRQTPGTVCVGGATDQEKTQILQSGTYGYAHVWELQQLRAGAAPDGTPGEQRTGPRIITTCPEFGSHLGRPPGCASPKDHSYESPRFQGHTCNTGRRNVPDVHQGIPSGISHTGIPPPPNCHEFDFHIKTSVGAPNTALPQEDPNEARYTD